MEAADLLQPEHRAAAIRVLFGSTGRFALASWLIGRGKPAFVLSDYAKETGHRALSAGHLAQFLQMGMVKRLSPGISSAGWYTVVPSPLWQVYRRAVDVLGDPVAAENEQMRADLLKLVARHSTERS